METPEEMRTRIVGKATQDVEDFTGKSLWNPRAAFADTSLRPGEKERSGTRGAAGCAGGSRKS